jgi:predicted porin
MKHAVPALAVLAALFPFHSSHAQSTTQIYGLIDAGVEVVDNARTGGGSLVKVISGGKNTSRWGIRGSEELGGGLKAVWNLEGGILMDVGASDGAIFKRQAWVGLDGALGRIVIGRSFTTVYETVIKFDPLGFAPNYSWATGGSATGPSKYGMTTQFDNLVKYTGKSGGFTYGASVGLGERSESSADGRKIALGGSWVGSAIGLMATWERVNGSTAPAGAVRDDSTAWHLAASYQSGDWRHIVGMRKYDNRGSAGLRANTYWGAIIRTIDAVTLTGAVYHIDTRNPAAAPDANPTMVVLRAMYALSPRTVLYLSGARARAGAGQTISLSRDDEGYGSTQRGISAGIQHRF